jgi:phage terminase small subunit
LKNSKAARPPEELSKAAQALWRRLVDEYSVTDSAGLAVLEAGLQAFDRYTTCRARIEADGAVSIDRFGQAKPHVLLAAERDSRAAFLSAMKQLNFDLEPLRDRPGRPTGGGGAHRGHH